MIIFYILIGVVVVIALIRINNAPKELTERKSEPNTKAIKTRKKKSDRDQKRDQTWWADSGGADGGGFDGGGSDGGDGSSTGF